jgi:quercetin dioxygenase-like cupin family protein
MQLSLGAAIFLCLGPAPAAEPDPAVLTYKLPDQIKWVENGRGGAQAVLVGDPAKPGLYVVLTKWYAGNMSRPHSHPTVRYITVLSGTWWLGWGDKYDPDSTYPVKAGSFVTHFANQIHYDGAKGEDAVLQIVGIGPAESAPANRKQ